MREGGSGVMAPEGQGFGGMNAQHIEELGQRFLQRLRRGFLDPAVNRRLASVATMALIVLVAWTAAGLTWQWFSPPPPLPELRAPLETPSSRSPRPAPVEKIVNTHLFGQANVVPVKTKGPIEAPETRLRLRLHGVFASPDPALAMAIIAEKGGRDRAYRRGDALPGGATLHEIYPDRVILSRNGRLETLRLIRKHDRASVGTATKPRKPNAGASPPGRRTVRRVPQLQEVKQLYRDDPQKLLKQIRITPVMKDGELVGYRFNHNDRALMRAAGLLPQDVITEINGVSVQDTSGMFSLMQNIDQLQELQLVIMRRGIPQQLTLKLN